MKTKLFPLKALSDKTQGKRVKQLLGISPIHLLHTWSLWKSAAERVCLRKMHYLLEWHPFPLPLWNGFFPNVNVCVKAMEAYCSHFTDPAVFRVVVIHGNCHCCGQAVRHPVRFLSGASRWSVKGDIIDECRFVG